MRSGGKLNHLIRLGKIMLRQIQRAKSELPKRHKNPFAVFPPRLDPKVQVPCQSWTPVVGDRKGADNQIFNAIRVERFDKL